MIGRNVLTATLDHRLGIIDTDNFYIGLLNMTTGGQCCRATGTAEIVNITVGRDKTFG